MKRKFNELLWYYGALWLKLPDAKRQFSEYN
jgi:hypothetical protein